MKSVLIFAAAALALAASFAQAAPSRGSVVDLSEVELVPREIGRFQIRPACAPGGGPPSVCRALASAAPTLTFRLRAQPTGLDAGDWEALRVSSTPMTDVLGTPTIKPEGLNAVLWQICGRRIFETDAVDQYGGAWTLTPYMYQQADGRWNHLWTVAPNFAGYVVAAVDGRPSVAVVRTREELERRKGWMQELLDKYFSGNPF
jgi:hypothetical protein